MMVSDFNQTGLIRYLPHRFKPFYLLARLDRPTGWHLLFWPCSFGLALGMYEAQQSFAAMLFWTALFWCGAFSMRIAGCVWNDILDRNFDRQVARTQNRPLANGTLNLMQASLFCLGFLLVSFGVFLSLPTIAQIMVLFSLPLVLIYPLMKRIISTPQIILGIIFNWGVLVGYSCMVEDYPSVEAWLLWGGCLFWTLGYDTIYACQDKIDDQKASVKSMALLLAPILRPAITSFYLIFACLYGVSFWSVSPLPALAMLLILSVILHRLYHLNSDDPKACLAFFRDNRLVGMGCFLSALTPLIVS